MKILFWISFIIIIYTYFGYPICIFFISLFIKNKVYKKDIEPSVTFLITAYNEEKNIKKKIENTLSLDYPKNKLEIIVVSDGSVDKTNKIVEKYKNKGINLLKIEKRIGKTEAQNQAVQIARGEIILFSDADSIYEKFVIRKLIRNFSDSKVGCVGGKCEYVNSYDTLTGFVTKIYWAYESFIKKVQTNINTLTGVSGTIYAIKKDLYTPLSKDIISDLVEPLKIIEKGYRVIYEPEAVAYERTTEDSNKEFKMRIRVISRGMHGIMMERALLNPLKYKFVSFQIFSHKILRWLMFTFIITLFIVNIFLIKESFYKTLFSLQIAFYFFVLIGFFLEYLNRRIKFFSIPLFFFIVNFAAFISFFNTIFGKKIILWETKRY